MSKKKKTVIIVVSIILVLILVYVICALTGNLQPADENNSKPEATTSPLPSGTLASYGWNPADSSNEIGTTARADEIQLKGINDAKNITKDDAAIVWDQGIQYLKEHSSNFFESTEIMEQSLYYGSSICKYIEENAAADNASQLPDSTRAAYDGAQHSVQAIKYVYRGSQSIEDEVTQFDLKEAQENLAKFK